MNKKVVQSSSSRFKSAQICVFIVSPTLLCQERSNINICSNCCSFVLWTCSPQVLQKLGKTMETKDEQFELCSQKLNKQQVPQRLLPATERDSAFGFKDELARIHLPKKDVEIGLVMSSLISHSALWNSERADFCLSNGNGKEAASTVYSHFTADITPSRRHWYFTLTPGFRPG